MGLVLITFIVVLFMEAVAPHYLISQAMVAGTVFVWNFSTNREWDVREKDRAA